MFEAEDNLWDQRIQENPKLEKFREKARHNWDKLFELYGDIRATCADASELKEKSKRLNRGLHFDVLRLDTGNFNSRDFVANESSSYGNHVVSPSIHTSTTTPDFGSTQQSQEISRFKNKRKSSLISVMKDEYKTMAVSIDKLSMALVGIGEKVAGTRFDVNQNSMIFDALSALGLEEDYKVRCYFYLSANPSKAAPNAIKGKILKDIMASTGDEH